MLSSPFQFAIAASFTADHIESSLSFWGRWLDADFAVRFAPYNQVHQTLLDPRGCFASNSRGVNVALVRLEDLGQFDAWNDTACQAIEANLQSLLGAVRESSARFPVPLIFCLCPPSEAASARPGIQAWLDAMLALTHRALDDVPGVHLLEFNHILAAYPMTDWNDPDAERLARIPYNDRFFCALATSIVRLSHALTALPYKVIALDCDDTLWSGVCGEDGPDGVRITESHRLLQQFAIEQRDAGALLALVSKNNEQDVIDTFAAHPEMPLRLDHFIARRINWHPKAQNLVEIAGELDLGLDSFALIDDNPRECAEVAGALPQVLSLALPAEPEIPHFLQHIWALDRPQVTEEDRLRNVYYAQSQEFGRALQQAESLDHFISALQLRVDLLPARPADLPRVAQLTQRTNQFNFSVIRRTEAELESLLANPACRCLVARVSDRFGDYGLVGVAITREEGAALDLDTFLLSCRVLGRGVEHHILAGLARTVANQHIDTLRLRWTPAPRNLPARQFLEEVTGSPIDPSAPFTAALPVSRLAGLRYTPATLPSAANPPAEKPSPSVAPRKFVDFARIARELSTPDQILAAMRNSRDRAAADQPGHDAATETEATLAAIWRDLLEAAAVSRNDNFFDIGGHSLLAVLLILRVKEAFGIELPVEDVYSPSITLADLALKIENYQLSGVNPDQYAKLLAEIEELSDEEVTRLLAEEDTES